MKGKLSAAEKERRKKLRLKVARYRARQQGDSNAPCLQRVGHKRDPSAEEDSVRRRADWINGQVGVRLCKLTRHAFRLHFLPKACLLLCSDVQCHLRLAVLLVASKNVPIEWVPLVLLFAQLYQHRHNPYI